MSWFTVHVPAEPTRGVQDFSVVELHAPTGDRSPLHRHEREDEVFVVVEGLLRVWVAGRPTDLGPGASLTGPRGVAHGYEVLEGPARFLVVARPGGLERVFEAMEAGREDAFASHGIEVLGDLPGDGG